MRQAIRSGGNRLCDEPAGMAAFNWKEAKCTKRSYLCFFMSLQRNNMHTFPLTLNDSKAVSDENRIYLQPLFSQNISVRSTKTKFLLY